MQSDEMSRLLGDLRENEMISSSFAFGDTHHVTIKGNSRLHESGRSNPEVLKEYLTGRGHNNIVINVIEAGIEDCFMELSES